MSKKDISDNGLNAILGSFAKPVEEAVHEPDSPKDVPSAESPAQEPAEESRRRGRPVGTTKSDVLRRPFSMKMQEVHYDKLSSVAYWDRLSKQDVVDMALEEFFSRYEKKNGAIKPAE